MPEHYSEERLKEAIFECREMALPDTAREYSSEWLGSLEDCGYCGEKLTPELEFFADSEINPGDGIWGLLCPVCLTYGGNEMIWGKGQLYQYQTKSNSWVLVAGFMPKRLRDEG